MLVDLTKKELEYIVTALWKCRKTEGEPQCVQVYDKLKPLLEVCTCKENASTN